MENEAKLYIVSNFSTKIILKMKPHLTPLDKRTVYVPGGHNLALL